MNKIKRILTFTISLLLLFTIIVNADRLSDFDYSTLPDADRYFYAYDETYTLKEADKEFIINRSNELYRKSGVQVVVAVVNSLNGMTIENYATRLFEKWEIGDKNDQGLLFVIKPKTDTEDGQVRIEVGYGLLKVIPAQRADQIIRNVMIPKFKDLDMESGIMDGYKTSLGLISDYLGVKLEGIRAVDDVPYEDDRPSPFRAIILLIILFLLIRFGGMGPLFWLNAFSGGNRRSGGGFGGFGGGFGGGGFSGGGGRSGGGGSSGSW